MRNTTHLSEISDKQDGEPVMAIAGEVKYASDINRGTSAKGNEWSRQFFVLAENGTEVGCTLWDADDGSVKKGEHVRFENTQNKKGQWSGIVKTSYTDKKNKLCHGLEIRANQVKWGNNLSGGVEAVSGTGLKTRDYAQPHSSGHAERLALDASPANTRSLPDARGTGHSGSSAPPAQNSLDGITEARQHLCQAANLYNLCVKAVDKMIAPELPLTAQNSDMFQAATGTLFIEASRNGFVTKMPTKPLRNGNDKAEEIPSKEEGDDYGIGNPLDYGD